MLLGSSWGFSTLPDTHAKQEEARRVHVFAHFLKSFCSVRDLIRTVRTCYAVNKEQNTNDKLVKFSPYKMFSTIPG